MRAARLPAPVKRTQPEPFALGQRAHVSRWELVLLLAASLNYWTDLLRLMFPGVDSTSIAFRAIHFLFYGFFVLMLVRNVPALLKTLRRMPLLLLFLIMPLASVSWSVNSGETLTRAIALLGSSLFGIYVATQLRPLLALRLLAWTGAIAAAISLVLIFAFPSVGLMSEGEYVNVWSGAFIHKNGMGQMTALGAIISIILLMHEGVRRNVLISVGLVLNLVLLAGSRSLTSQVVFVASVVLILTVGRFVRFIFNHALLVAIIVAPALLAIVTTLSVDDVFVLLASVGKDATMSSRVPLWQILAGFIEERYWLGWGYEAFFTEANFAIRVIEAKLHFKPYYSHNGYIETWLAVGAVGFALLAGVFLHFSSLAAVQLYRDDRNPLYLLCFVYVPIFLIQNTAEVTILQRNSMSWALFVMLYVLLVRAVAASTQRAAPAAPLNRTIAGMGRLPVQ
jgi:exopolysaccharide production protein ExoQ